VAASSSDEEIATAPSQGAHVMLLSMATAAAPGSFRASPVILKGKRYTVTERRAHNAVQEAPIDPGVFFVFLILSRVYRLP